MDARRCISYLTIELRDSIPLELREGIGRHIFGCDICQDVCPWNRKAPETSLPEFQPRSLPPVRGSSGSTAAESLFLPSLRRLAAITQAEFREAFGCSPVKRTKWRGLVRNACVALGNARDEWKKSSPETRKEILSLLERLAASTESTISEHAQWALSRIQQDVGTRPRIPPQQAPGV